MRRPDRPRRHRPMNAILPALLLGLVAPPERTRQPQQKLYVANSAGTGLHVIDTATNKVIRRVEVGPQPHGVVATGDGSQLFLTIENAEGDEGEFVWFDPLTDKVA